MSTRPEGTSTTPASGTSRHILQQLSKLVEIWWWNRRCCCLSQRVDRLDCLSDTWLPGLPLIGARSPVSGFAGGLRRLWLQTSMSLSWAWRLHVRQRRHYEVKVSSPDAHTNATSLPSLRSFSPEFTLAPRLAPTFYMPKCSLFYQR